MLFVLNAAKKTSLPRAAMPFPFASEFGTTRSGKTSPDVVIRPSAGSDFVK